MAKVLLGMSGGVDSSVAAALLVEQGHEVIGMTIKTYKYEDVGGAAGALAANDTSCCSLDGINDARRVAMQLGIPHYVTDLTVEFGTSVIEYFKETYLAGETPNPCVKCNREIKWSAMLRKADALGCEFIATGHYAKLRNEAGRMILSRSADAGKDQTYSLWAVREADLHRTLFPLADFQKNQSREAARKFNLPIAEKQESFEICFVADNNYRRFLRETVPNIELRAPKGQFILNGEAVADHDGLPFYTVGQRKGLGLSLSSHPAPLYVTGLDVLNNQVILGDEDDLLAEELSAHSVNMIKYAVLPDAGLRVSAKIRYKDEGSLATVFPVGPDEFRVLFDEPRRAITPGQSVVLYEGDDLVGGGIIR